MTIQNPVVWSWEQIRAAQRTLASDPPETYWGRAGEAKAIRIRRIGTSEVRLALAKGVEDFTAHRTDVMFACLLYPVIGLVLERLMFGYGAVEALFPVASGFAILGPIVGLGLYEMSRRRELYGEARWIDMFRVLRSPALGRIAGLAATLIVLYLLWLVLAEVIYRATLGATYGLDDPGPTLGRFLHDTFTTRAGWMMIVIGTGVGFLIAAVAFAVSVVFFPLLLDRGVGLNEAIGASLRAIRINPGPMALWAALIAAGLVLGSIPAFIGLIVIIPVLGHASWHLYRQLVMAEEGTT